MDRCGGRHGARPGERRPRRARASAGWPTTAPHVVKVGPVPSRGGAQITPPLYAYSGGRGTERIRLDLKATPAARRSCAWPSGPTSSSRASGPASSPGSASATTTSRDATRASSTARPAATARTGRGRSGPATTSTTSPSAATSLHRARRGRQAAGARRDGGRQRRRRHARGRRDPRRTGRTRRTGEGAYLDVSVADGMLALMALQVDEHLATGVEPEPGTACSAAATPATTPTRRRRRLARGRRHRGEVLGQPVPRCSGSTMDRRSSTTTARRTDPRRRRAASSPQDRATSGSPCSRRPTPASPRCSSVAEAADDRAFGDRGAVRDRAPAHGGELRQLAPLFAGADAPSVVRRPRHDRHRHRRAARRCGVHARGDRRLARRRSGRMTAVMTAASRRRRADRPGAVRGDRRVPGRARLHLDRRARRSRTATRCSGTTRSRPS